MLLPASRNRIPREKGRFADPPLREPIAYRTGWANGSRHRHTGFGHDILGRVVEENVEIVGTNPGSSPAKLFEWTTLGQPKAEVGRDGTVQSFEYNADGQLTSAEEDLHGSSLAANYYLNGWLRDTATDQPGTAARYQQSIYTGDGLELWRTFGEDPTFAQTSSIQAFTYNDARATTQVTAVGWGFGWDSWTLGHDRAGQTITMTDPPSGATPARTTLIDRNPDGTVAQQTLHSGAAGSSVTDQWTYTYDAAGRVGSRTRTGTTGVTTVNDTYGYDEAGRLATINSGQINYDPNGNRLSGPGMPTLTFHADNSIATGPGPNGSEAYLYAPWGGLTRDGCRTYGYDGFDRSQATTVRTDALGLLPRCLDLLNPVEQLLAPNDTKRYDALGRQVWARHQTLNTLGLTVSTEYNNLHHVGLTQTLAYKQTVGAPARSGRYVNTPGGTPLAVSDNNGNYQFLHRDGQNNTTAAVRPNGSVACGPRLDPWGDTDTACTGHLSQATPNDRWFNSSRLDTATGTYQWGARTYNPTTATWQQPDTSHGRVAPSQVSIGSDPMVANRYAYVNGDPINLWDPTGHCALMRFSSDPEAADRCRRNMGNSARGGGSGVRDEWSSLDFAGAIQEVETLSGDGGFSESDPRMVLDAVTGLSEAGLAYLGQLKADDAARLLDVAERRLVIARAARVSPGRFLQAMRLLEAMGQRGPVRGLVTELAVTEIQRARGKAAIGTASARARAASQSAEEALSTARRLKQGARFVAGAGIVVDTWLTFGDLGNAESGREVAETVGGFAGRHGGAIAAGAGMAVVCTTGLGCVVAVAGSGVLAGEVGDRVGEKVGGAFHEYFLDPLYDSYKCLIRLGARGC